MEMNPDQLCAIIGVKEYEIVLGRMTINAQAKRIAELEAKYEPKEPAKPELKAVEGS